MTTPSPTAEPPGLPAPAGDEERRRAVGVRAPDEWPGTDLVLGRSLAERAAAGPTSGPPAADRWSPYRGYAAMHLWNQSSREQAQR